MEKIPTIFERDWDNNPSLVLNEPVASCDWVFEGFGVPTRKYDGICVMYDGMRWWARREVKADKEAPANFVALSTDPETGDTVGWELVDQSPFFKFFNEAADAGPRWDTGEDWRVGTYELIGPKINKNREHVIKHALIQHANAQEIMCATRTFESIRTVLEPLDIEGIVFHHADGRMGKIKKRDFGLRRDES